MCTKTKYQNGWTDTNLIYDIIAQNIRATLNTMSLLMAHRVTLLVQSTNFTLEINSIMCYEKYNVTRGQSEYIKRLGKLT